MVNRFLEMSHSCGSYVPCSFQQTICVSSCKSFAGSILYFCFISRCCVKESSQLFGVYFFQASLFELKEHQGTRQRW